MRLVGPRVRRFDLVHEIANDANSLTKCGLPLIIRGASLEAVEAEWASWQDDGPTTCLECARAIAPEPVSTPTTP